jgi:FtsZ-interacting cell division protein YlmF
MYRGSESQQQAAEQDEMEGGLWNRIGRLKDREFGVPEEEEDYDEPQPAPPPAHHGGARAYRPAATAAAAAAPRRDTFRIASAREGSISVMPVTSFGDIQKAADRLKGGEPQIINLEKTPAELTERLIDFLNGVTYALDGFVEKISEGAYLFTPSHIAIHADGPETAQPKPFFDR